MTNESETGQDQRAARGLLTDETRRTLDEVARHSLGRTGKVAHAIEAGLASLRDAAVLAPGHRESLEEFACMVSESTPSANGAGIGMRCVRWRDAVLALLGVLRPDPLRELFTNLAASLTPQQAEQLACPLSEQQRDFFQQVVNLTRHDEVVAESDTVTLEDLCGQRMLSGRGEMVLESAETSDDNAFVVVLRLDDTLYWFQEDPSDGYRSSLGTIKKLRGWPQDMPPSAFVAFDPVMVTLRMRTEPADPQPDSSQKDEVLYGLDERTGRVLFEVGTEDIGDYYPNFVHRWSPEGVAPKWLAARPPEDGFGAESPRASQSPDRDF